MLHGKRLDLHLAAPAVPARRDLLVVYASGDGGWFGTAVDQWRQIARSGYVAVGFSARALLRIDRPVGAPLNAARLADEYVTIVHEAQRALGRTAAPTVVLTGWSRGAAFAVLVGSEPSFADRLAGVVAMGLADGEDLTIDGDGDDTDDGASDGQTRRWPFDTYALLERVPCPSAVIQATHDNYFPAGEAHLRFGPDTAMRRFYQVEAKNHRFSGGMVAFDSALTDALAWLSSDAGSADAVATSASPAQHDKP